MHSLAGTRERNRPAVSRASASPPQKSRCSLAQKADDPETLFVATGDGAVGTTGAIQRSTNGGKSWQTAHLPVKPNSPIWAFATHPADPGLIVACSHYGELYKTVNAGDSWTKLPREFTEIRALSWTPN